MDVSTHWLSFGSHVTFLALVTCGPLHALDSQGSPVPWQSWLSLNQQGSGVKMIS